MVDFQLGLSAVLRGPPHVVSILKAFLALLRRFLRLLYDVMQGEDLVCPSLPFPKPCLLSFQLLVHCVGYSLDEDLGQDLAGNILLGDSSPAVAVV